MKRASRHFDSARRLQQSPGTIADFVSKWTPESSGHSAYYNRLINPVWFGNSQRMFANSLETTIAVISSRRTARYSDAPVEIGSPEGVAREVEMKHIGTVIRPIPYLEDDSVVPESQ